MIWADAHKYNDRDTARGRSCNCWHLQDSLFTEVEGKCPSRIVMPHSPPMSAPNGMNLSRQQRTCAQEPARYRRMITVPNFSPLVRADGRLTGCLPSFHQVFGRVRHRSRQTLIPCRVALAFRNRQTSSTPHVHISSLLYSFVHSTSLE